MHTDHLHRPVKMSDASKVMQWSAEYQPWGAVQSLSGPLSLDLRFPGQWFQLEPACITTGTGITIQARAATPNPIRSASSMGRVCMGMRVVIH